MSNEIIDIKAIFSKLPHRYPFLLVDRILEFEPGVSITGLKNVSINEPFFQGHFPGEPVMPGVLILESMAQTGGMLSMLTKDKEKPSIVYFMSIDKAKFRKVVTPGDSLHIKMTVLRQRRNVWSYRGEAFVDGVLACEAEMKAMVVEDDNANAK